MIRLDTSVAYGACVRLAQKQSIEFNARSLEFCIAGMGSGD